MLPLLETHRLLKQSLYLIYWNSVPMYRLSPLHLCRTVTQNELLIEKEILEVSKKTTPIKHEKPAAQAVKWVNRNLTEEEKADHDERKYTPQGVYKDLIGLAVSGYNFSLKWDGYSSCFQATLIPYNTACHNFGYGLSSRSADAFRAVSLLLHKHFRVLEEDWVSGYVERSQNFEG